MIFENIFSIRLKKQRKLKGLSQTALGEIIGLKPQAVNDMEHGRVKTTLDRASTLANYFNVPIDYLLGNGIFSNWEEIIERKEQVIDSLEETVPMLKELNLSKASEKQLMRILPAFIDRIEFDDDKNALIINFYA